MEILSGLVTQVQQVPQAFGTVWFRDINYIGKYLKLNKMKQSQLGYLSFLQAQKDFLVIICSKNVYTRTSHCPLFLLAMFTGAKHFYSCFYLLQRTYTTSLCSCNFHRTTVTRLSCSCYRYAVNILVCSENALKINIYSVNIENILGERKKSHIVLNSVEVDGNGPGI